MERNEEGQKEMAPRNREKVSKLIDHFKLHKKKLFFSEQDRIRTESDMLYMNNEIHFS